MAERSAEAVRDDLAVFFGARGAAYLAYYDRMAAAGGRYAWSWNWPAALVGFPWFFYRRQYLAGTLLAVVPMGLDALLGLGGLTVMIASLAMGAAADHLYVQHALRRLAEADALGLPPEARTELLRRTGGVSRAAGVLAALALVAASLPASLEAVRQAQLLLGV